MNTVIIRKNNSSKEDEFEQVFDTLLSCLSPYKEIEPYPHLQMMLFQEIPIRSAAPCLAACRGDG